jgi:hypothetical protein
MNALVGLALGWAHAQSPTPSSPTWSADGAPLLPVLPDLPYVVLATGAPESWSGPLKPAHLPSFPDDPFALRAAPATLPKGKLEKRLGRWVGAPLYVVDTDGAACETSITGLEVITRASWMEGFAPAELATCPGAGCAEALAGAMNDVGSERLLVGRLTTTCGVVDHARVARGTPFAAAPVTAPTSERRIARATSLFYELPAYADAAATWAALPPSDAAAVGDGTVTPRPAWRDATGAPSVLHTRLGNVTYVLASVGTGGCMPAPEAMGVWGLWRVDKGEEADQGGPDWHLVATGTTDGDTPWPTLATDVNADGIPEWLTGREIWWATRFSNPDLLPRVGFAMPWMGCAC